MDGRRDMTKLIVVFSNFAKAPKKTANQLENLPLNFGYTAPKITYHGFWSYLFYVHNKSNQCSISGPDGGVAED